ncbi:MAG: hypothetical protein RLZZ450_4211 [Pseudomonadota bacterium]|jgi:hypothetical protein
MTQLVANQQPPARNVSLQLDSPELASTYEQVSVRQFNHGKVLIASQIDRGVSHSSWLVRRGWERGEPAV